MIANIQVHDLPVSQTLRNYAQRILDYDHQDPEVHIANRPDFLPTNRLGGVLVLLYERDGAVRVLLTTRSKLLRSHPGEVALPGGKSDPDDKTPFITALREANEEVGLPSNSPNIHVLRTMPPFPSLYRIIVTPVVAILSNLSVLDSLKPNPGEVDDIFDHPLEAFLDPTMMNDEPKLSPPDSEKWPYPEELWSYRDHPFIAGFYRNNRFRSTSTPIRGLTSSLMVYSRSTHLAANANKPLQIQLAMVVYDRGPSFQAFAEGAVPTAQVINKILNEAKAEALLPPYLRVPASTPDMGMSRATTPLPSLPRGPQGPESPSTSAKSGEEAGDTIPVMPASTPRGNRIILPITPPKRAE